MDISIPDKVQLWVMLEQPLDSRVVGQRPRAVDLCFTHAVKAAMLGHKVEMQLTDSESYIVGCDLCSIDRPFGSAPGWIRDKIRKPPADVVE